MEIFFEILIGAGIGWMVGITMRVVHEETFLTDMFLSILGALAGGVFLQVTSSQISFSNVVIASMLGTLVLLSIVSAKRKLASNAPRRYSHS